MTWAVLSQRFCLSICLEFRKNAKDYPYFAKLRIEKVSFISSSINTEYTAFYLKLNFVILCCYCLDSFDSFPSIRYSDQIRGFKR